MGKVDSSSLGNSLLVVGGSGFIGRYVVKEGADRGCKVTVISLRHVNEDQKIDNVEYLTVDIARREHVVKSLSERSFEYIVNLGGYIDHSAYKKGGRAIIDSHFIGVMNLIAVLDWSKLRAFIQVGSSDEYGSSSAPQKEISNVDPISSYSLGKLAAEQLLLMLYRTEGFPVINLRLFLVYGPGQDNQRFLPQIIMSCLDNKEFSTSYGEQLRDFCYIDDVVEGIFLAMNNVAAQGEIINIASGKPLEIKTAINYVVNKIGRGTPMYGEFSYRSGENMELYADIGKARKLLGWRPKTTFEEGMISTINYFRSINEKSMA